MCKNKYESKLKECPNCGLTNYRYSQDSSLQGGFADEVNEIVKIFKALANSNRIKILKLLRQGEKTRREIADEIGVALEAAVKHCDELKDIGVVTETGRPNPERGGYITKYFLNIQGLKEVLRKISVFFNFDQLQTIEAQQSVNRIMDKAKDNVKMATDQARKQVPQYVQATKDYQEQNLQAAAEIADNYIESQRSIINSFQNSWMPYIGNTNGMFYHYNWWFSPQNMANIYAKTIGSFTDYMTSAAKIAFNTTLANLEASKIYMGQIGDIAKQLSRMGVNAAKTFGITPMPLKGGRSVSSTALAEEDIRSATLERTSNLAAAMMNLRSDIIEILR